MAVITKVTSKTMWLMAMANIRTGQATDMKDNGRITCQMGKDKPCIQTKAAIMESSLIIGGMGKGF